MGEVVYTLVLVGGSADLGLSRCICESYFHLYIINIWICNILLNIDIVCSNSFYGFYVIICCEFLYFICVYIFLQTSVALGVLAALAED